MLVSFASVAGSAEAKLRPLFKEEQAQVAAAGSNRRTEVRGRRVKIDISAVAGADLPDGADALELNLFTDKKFEAVKSRFERRDDTHFTWFGKVSDDPQSTVILLGSEGRMRGLVYAHGRHFSIRGSAASQEVVEFDQSAFPEENCDQSPAGDGTQSAPARPSSPDVLPDTGSTIDVLVVYTAAAQSAAGGGAAMLNLAQDAVDFTNASYGNSGITPRLNLVHAAQVAYTESGSGNIDLSRLSGTNDGFMDIVHTLRDSYRADVVVLLTDDPTSCGMANIAATATTAFAVVAWDCAVDNYSFGHEIGHLQGARHDRYADPVDGPNYTYNHGDVDLTLRKRTIMAYNSQCLATSPYTPCDRLGYWSNPDVPYPGTSRSTGSVAYENNAKVLNNTAATVANFRYLPWVGSVSITSNKNVVAVGRPHIGSEVASYDGFSAGALSAYLPMLFKDAFGGSYDSAFYVQNVAADNTANLTIDFYDTAGNLSCTKTDQTVAPLASQGYWLPSEACLPTGWVGGVVITSDQPIVAIGRPHIGAEIMTYDGFSSGALTSYLPMLFKDAFGGSYDSAFYVQNVDNAATANLTIGFYDNAGTLSCTKAGTVAPLASKGYWLPSEACLPTGWVGGVVVTSDQPIVTVGRPHLGDQITTYNGFSSGAFSSYLPMLFKGAFGGAYNAAFYVQNVDNATTANLAIEYYDSSGFLNCTVIDTVAAFASQGYWVPNQTCLPAGWAGGVVVTSDQPVVAVGRPHIGTAVSAYNGFLSGNLNSYLPMLFNAAFGGSYNSAFYIQNTEASAADVTIKFYNSSGALTCTRDDTIPALANLGFWLPSLTCLQ